MITSQKAYNFGKSVISWRLSEKNNESASTDQREKNHKAIINAPLIEKNKAEIDYRKFDQIEQQLDAEEKWDKLMKDEENLRRRAGMGCSQDHSKERQIFEKPTMEKIEAADQFRTEGNNFFSNKEYQLAAVSYRRALIYFDYTFPETPEETSYHDKVKLAVHLNMAAVKLHLDDNDEVLSQCRQALELDPKSLKAYFRRATVYLRKGDFDRADEDIEDALEIDSTCSEILKLKADVKKAKINYLAKRKALFKRAVGSKEEPGNTNDSPKNTDEIDGDAIIVEEERRSERSTSQGWTLVKDTAENKKGGNIEEIPACSPSTSSCRYDQCVTSNTPTPVIMKTPEIEGNKIETPISEFEFDKKNNEPKLVELVDDHKLKENEINDEYDTDGTSSDEVPERGTDQIDKEVHPEIISELDLASDLDGANDQAGLHSQEVSSAAMKKNSPEVKKREHYLKARIIHAADNTRLRRRLEKERNSLYDSATERTFVSKALIDKLESFDYILDQSDDHFEDNSVKDIGNSKENWVDEFMKEASAASKPINMTGKTTSFDSNNIIDEAMRTVHDTLMKMRRGMDEMRAVISLLMVLGTIVLLLGISTVGVGCWALNSKAVGNWVHQNSKLPISGSTDMI